MVAAKDSLGDNGKSDLILEILRGGGGLEDLRKAKVLSFLAQEMGRDPSTVFADPLVDALTVAMDILTHGK